MFEKFLKSYLGDQYDYTLLSVTIIQINNEDCQYSYYKRETSDGKTEIMINGVDDHIWEDGVSFDTYEEIVISIMRDRKVDIEQFEKLYFTLLTCDDGKFKRHAWEPFVSFDSIFPEFDEDLNNITT